MPLPPRRIHRLAGSIPLAVVLLVGAGCGPDEPRDAADPSAESLPPASEAVPSEPGTEPESSSSPSTSRSTSAVQKSASTESSDPTPPAGTRTSKPTSRTAGDTGDRDRPRVRSTSGDRAGSSATASSAETFDRALVREVNELRARYGLRPLTVSPTLEGLAEDCSARNVDLTRLTHCGYENLYATSADHVAPATVVDAWAESTPHRAAMLLPTARYAGGGIESNDTKTVVALRIG